MKIKFLVAIKNVLRNSKKEITSTKKQFASSKVVVPKNNLQLGELKVVYNKESNKIKNIVKANHKYNNQIKQSKNFDKDKFMSDIMKWSKELEMTDEEYIDYQKKQSLEYRMEHSNIRVLNK